MRTRTGAKANRKWNASRNECGTRPQRRRHRNPHRRTRDPASWCLTVRPTPPTLGDAVEANKQGDFVVRGQTDVRQVRAPECLLEVGRIPARWRAMRLARTRIGFAERAGRVARNPGDCGAGDLGAAGNRLCTCSGFRSCSLPSSYSVRGDVQRPDFIASSGRAAVPAARGDAPPSKVHAQSPRDLRVRLAASIRPRMKRARSVVSVRGASGSRPPGRRVCRRSANNDGHLVETRKLRSTPASRAELNAVAPAASADARRWLRDAALANVVSQLGEFMLGQLLRGLDGSSSRALTWRRTVAALPWRKVETSKVSHAPPRPAQRRASRAVRPSDLTHGMRMSACCRSRNQGAGDACLATRRGRPAKSRSSRLVPGRPSPDTDPFNFPRHALPRRRVRALACVASLPRRRPARCVLGAAPRRRTIEGSRPTASSSPPLLP